MILASLNSLRTGLQLCIHPCARYQAHRRLHQAKHLGDKFCTWIVAPSTNLACSCGYDDGQVTPELIALSVSEAKFLGVVNDVLQFVW